MAGATVVIGAGLAGLSAAIHLAAAGREVVVVEAGESPGGCCGTTSVNGYRFDTGPSVLTAPDVVEEAVGAAGEDLRDWLPLAELDPYYRITFHDGSHLDVVPGAERMAAEVARLAGPAEAARYLAFRERLSELHEAEWTPFIASDTGRLAGLARPQTLAALARLIRLGGLRRLSALAERHLRDWRLIRAHTFQALYVGLDPHAAWGVYAVVPYLDTVGGVFVPRAGGMRALPRALADVAVRAGAALRCSCRAERIVAGPDGVRAVLLSGGERLAADAVVMTGDVVAQRSILPSRAADWRLRRPHFAPSCLVAHFGLDRPRPAGAHHTVHLGSQWREAFRALTAESDIQPGPDPNLLVTSPTRDPGAAPAGHSTLSVLEPTANLSGGHDWPATTPRLRDRLLARLAGLGYGDLSAAPAQLVIDPPGWASRGHAAGTPFGLDHRATQTGWFRPARAARRVPGLYFAGAGTAPGVGVPMVILSGRLAARAVLAGRR